MPKVATRSAGCPGDELVAAYVSVGLSDSERADIEAHLRLCDRCVATVALVQRRLCLADEVPAAVPATVNERVRALNPVEITASRRADWWSVVREWATALLRPPVLIPAAVAAVVLVLVVVPRPFTSPPHLTRGLPQAAQVLRVTGHAVPVYAQPSSRAAVVASVERGAHVTVRGEDRDWYAVVLPDGREGWIEREAFE